MALVHPTQDLTARRARRDAPLHPVFGLIGGFGLITAGAVVVHVLFNAFV